MELMEPSKELLKKELFENRSAVFDEINFQKLPFQQETLLVYQNEAVKEKGKKITWTTHLKEEVIAPTWNKPSNRCKPCNIVLNTTDPAQKAVRAIHGDVDVWKHFSRDEILQIIVTNTSSSIKRIRDKIVHNISDKDFHLIYLEMSELLALLGWCIFELQ